VPESGEKSASMLKERGRKQKKLWEGTVDRLDQCPGEKQKCGLNGQTTSRKDLFVEGTGVELEKIQC